MKHSGWFVLTVVLVLLTGCASGKSYRRADYDFSAVERVAVLAIEGDVRSQGIKNHIADYFNMELLHKGYVPVERSQVQRVLEEQEFQASEVTTQENAARAGRILNVAAVVVVNVPQFGEEIVMTAKMIDAEDGSILWAGSGSGGTGGDLLTIAGATVGAGVGILAGGDTSGKVAGGVAGGVLGGVAGRALTPRQAKIVQSVVEETCVELPERY